MAEDARRQKVDLAWAAVFETAVITAFLIGLLALAPKDDTTAWMTVLLLVGGAVSILNVVILLASPGDGPGLLAFGRLFVLLSLAGVVGTCVMGIVAALG
ncbi:MAG: hypothetical protein ACYTDY_05385 [Planctomycetota bacterium]|jgi:hypothetical protein